ncbi:MAG: hypothetical protein ACFE0Q_09145 [Anaerolineae bacterium]
MMDELQQVLRFTDADLKANASGVLSSSQRAQLRDRQRRSLRLLMGVAGAVALMTVGAVVLGGFGVIVLGTMALILGVMALVEYMIGYQTYSRDLHHNEIETVQGVVHYVMRGDSVMGIETRPAGIRIGDVQFLLMEDQARAFEEGAVYAVHIAPATNTLLSARLIQLDEAPAIDAEVAYWDIQADEQITDER